MREIKFRAWDKKMKSMMHVAAIHFERQELMICKDPAEGRGVTWPFSDFELMQFTGLHDKNGREIYDGDVVLTGKYEDKKDDIFVVRWAHCGFVFDPIDEELDLEEIIFHEKSEIIGNIHENPELLSGKEALKEGGGR